jgi:hypothetical protein
MARLKNAPTPSTARANPLLSSGDHFPTFTTKNSLTLIRVLVKVEYVAIYYSVTA